MEWFDFGVYSYLTVALGNAFFPTDNKQAEVLFVLGGFAIAFLARPIGGLFFGPLGDKIGRQHVLAITIILMAAATFAIGVLPGYDTIGIWAPIALILARLLQGFSTGGEYGGAATFMAEYSPDKQRGFLCSWLEFGTLGGFALGAGLVTFITFLLPTDAMHSWGWRIPFLCAAPLGLVGLYLRLKLEETPDFQGLKDAGKVSRSPWSDMFRDHWREMLQCIGVVILLNVAYYTFLTYMASYFETTLGIDEQVGRLVLICVMIGMMIVLTPLGALSDRIGRKPILIASASGFIILSVPVFMMMGSGSLPLLILGVAIFGFLVVMLSATLPATLPAMFATRTRYGSFAISYNVSTSAFGGTAPVVVASLVAATGIELVPAYYLIAAAAIAFVPILMLRETAGRPLRGAVTQTVIVDND